MSAELDRVAEDLAGSVTKALVAAARAGGLESVFRQSVATALMAAAEKAEEKLAALGVDSKLRLTARDEFIVARGRVDSVYNRLIVEYKRPGQLRSDKDAKPNRLVIEQVKTYILDVAQKERREASRLAGVATDGFFYIFVRRVGEGWVVDDPLPVDKESTGRFLRLLLSLSTGAALVPENLVEDFGPRTLRAHKAVSALYAALQSSDHPLVQKLFDQWSQFFGQATDYSAWADRIESKKEFRDFIRGMGLSPTSVEAPRAFFALHTYYALLIKFVASMASAHFTSRKSTPLADIAKLEPDAFRQALADLERGGLYREYGIRNFLEGDFFGWYLPAWNDKIEAATRGLVARLAEYDPGTLELAPENARDLLKMLYHTLLPREIRHTLGEYYTPDWLAERLIRQTLGSSLGDPQLRVLDPACGSGTFLVLLIKHIRARAQRSNLEPIATLHLILNNVVGIDLNPLAVVAARTNYLLALGDLLRHKTGPIDIPVYQADAVLTPYRPREMDRSDQLTFEFEGESYRLRTSVGEFNIPATFARRERMDALANVLDEAVEGKLPANRFLTRIASASHIDPEELEAAEPLLLALYGRLQELHAEGLNGVWARIIKNAFAPIFLEPCDYIVGNPPWVNWEHMPDDYRAEMVPLWQHYGLFPHGGMDTILGKGKKDISMLMTYVAVDRYLRRGGKLGFVLSQSLFKTSGAGQGFRRFTLPDGTPFGATAVEDMVLLNPFEGATNRTAIGIFAKGLAVRFPVSYSKWVKKGAGRGSSIGFDTPYEEVTTEKITYRQWQAAPVDADDPTSAWLAARPNALRALRKVLGPSHYVAREGSNTGGANAVYWLEVTSERPGEHVMVRNLVEGAKRKVESVKTQVEKDLVYPLLRGRDISRWKAEPSAHILLAQDPKTRTGVPEATMRDEYPRAWTYLKRFEDALRARKTQAVRHLMQRGAFYSMFAVGTYTLAAWKVVWAELGNELDAAVVGLGSVVGSPKTVIPDHTAIFVECQNDAEAHFLAAALNSSPSRLTIRNYIVLHPDPHILTNVRIPRFNRRDPTHSALARLSAQAHRAMEVGDRSSLTTIEQEIDQQAGLMWELTTRELADIRASLDDV